MSTSEVTPNVAPATSAPEAAPVAAVPATPATSSTPEPIKRQPGEDNNALIDRFFEEKKPVEKPAEAVKPEVKAGEPPKEEKPTEAPKEEAKPEAAIAEELDPELSLEETGVLGVKDLSEKLTPELAEQLEAAGVPKNALFAMARNAAQTAQFKEIFGDIDSAKHAHQSATQFSQADELFTSIKHADSRESAKEAIGAFIGFLEELDMSRDGDGNPIMENGRPVLQGNVQAFIGNLGDLMRERMIEDLAAEAKQTGNEELQAVADILKARASGAAPENEDIPATVKAERAAAKAELTEAHRLRAEDANRQFQSFEKRVLDDSLGQYNTLADKILGQTDLDDDDKQTARSRIIEGLADNLNANRLFKSELEGLRSRDRSDKTAQARIALNARYARQVIKSVAEPIIKKLGGKVISRQEEKRAKIAAQVTNTQKTEPRGASQTAKPPAPVDKASALKAWKADYAAKNGNAPSVEEQIDFANSLARNA